MKDVGETGTSYERTSTQLEDDGEIIVDPNQLNDELTNQIKMTQQENSMLNQFVNQYEQSQIPGMNYIQTP